MQTIVQEHVQKTEIPQEKQRDTINLIIPKQSTIIAYEQTKTYAQSNGIQVHCTLRPREQLSAVRQTIIARQQRHAMHEFLLKNDRAYHDAVMQEIWHNIEIIAAAVACNNITAMVYYRLHLNQAHIPDFCSYVCKFQYRVNQLFFDSDGRLKSINSKNNFEALIHFCHLLRQIFKGPTAREIAEHFQLDYLVDTPKSEGWFSTEKTEFTRCAMHRKVLSHPYNQKLLQLIKLCQQCQFDQAQQLAASMHDQTAEQILEHQLKAYKKVVCNKFGILHIYENDPEWTHLSAQAKREIASLPNGPALYNAYLHEKSVQKDKIKQTPKPVEEKQNNPQPSPSRRT